MLDVQVASHHLGRRRARIAGEPALDMQRLPRAGFLGLRDATTIFCRCALRALVELMRPDTKSVHDDQAQRASDGCIGPIAWAENVVPAVETEAAANRPVNNDDLALSGCTLEQPGYLPGAGGEPVNDGENYREILRSAARHYRIDCRLPHRASAVQVLHRHHDFVGIAIGLGEELVDEFLERRDYGETVRPALRVTVLDRLPGITESVVRQDLSGRTRHDSPCLPPGRRTSAASTVWPARRR